MYNVMVVDDEKLTRTFLSGMIPKLNGNWKVSATASDGAEALELLETLSIDLIITDIKMPIMDGVILCEKVNLLYPNIHLIILSGYDEFQFAQKAIKHNVSYYLLKPINNNELAKALNEISVKINKLAEESKSHNRLLGLSNLYKKEIAIKFIQAVIHDSYVKTQALLPLIYEHRMEILKEEGIIMIIDVEPSVVNNLDFIKNKDLTSLLIYQITKDTLKKHNCYVFLDEENRTLVYITYNHSEPIKKICKELYNPVAKAFKLSTNYNLVGYIGDSVSEMLQIKQSYCTAITCMFDVILQNSANDNTLYFYSKNLVHADKKKLDSIISNYVYAVKSQDRLSIKHARDLFNEFPKNMGLYLFYVLKRSLENKNDFLPNSLNVEGILSKYENLTIVNSDNLSEASIIESAKDYINKNYSSPISLSIIAEHLSISPSYLSNLFHETVGISYIKYLTELRLNEACVLLRHKRNMTIEQITISVGYLSVKHFSYVFKKKYGMTPGQYRKQNTSIN